MIIRSLLSLQLCTYINLHLYTSHMRVKEGFNNRIGVLLTQMSHCPCRGTVKAAHAPCCCCNLWKYIILAMDFYKGYQSQCWCMHTFKKEIKWESRCFCSENECFKHFWYSVAHPIECLNFPLCHSSPRSITTSSPIEIEVKHPKSFSWIKSCRWPVSCYKLKQMSLQKKMHFWRDNSTLRKERTTHFLYVSAFN